MNVKLTFLNLYGNTMNFLNLSEVAEILRVSPEAVRRQAKKGRLRGTKPGKSWRFAPADVNEYVERGYNLPATEEVTND